MRKKLLDLVGIRRCSRTRRERGTEIGVHVETAEGEGAQDAAEDSVEVRPLREKKDLPQLLTRLQGR